MLLPSACTLQLGYTARARFEPAADGMLVIQLRDVTDDGVEPGHLMRVQLHERVDRYLVREGDVLFRSRGERNIAIALGLPFSEPAIAVSPLMVLRPKKEVINPAFLAWSINQPDAQRHFDTIARGTSIRMVPKASLEDLAIDVPDLETQRRIVAIANMAAREEALLRSLAAAKRTLINRLLAERAKDKSSMTTHKERRA